MEPVIIGAIVTVVVSVVNGIVKVTQRRINASVEIARISEPGQTDRFRCLTGHATAPGPRQAHRRDADPPGAVRRTRGNLLAAVPHAQGGGIQVYSFPDGAPGFSLLGSSVPPPSGHHLGLWRGEPAIGVLLDGGISVFHALSGKPLWRYEDMSHRRAYPILRLLTVHDRRLALVVRPDQSPTFLDADADRVAFRVHPGARVDAVALAGEDLLGVLTTKDFTCLRLPAPEATPHRPRHLTPVPTCRIRPDSESPAAPPSSNRHDCRMSRTYAVSARCCGDRWPTERALWGPVGDHTVSAHLSGTHVAARQAP